MFSCSRRTYKKRIIIKKADALKLPFKNNFFDCSYLSFFLSGFEKPIKVMKEIKRVTKPSGEIIIYSTSSKKESKKSKYTLFKKLKMHFGFIGLSESIEKTIKKSNLRLISTKKYNSFLGEISAYYCLNQKEAA